MQLFILEIFSFFFLINSNIIVQTRKHVKIVGGVAAHSGEFKFAVSLQYLSRRHYCGGVLYTTSKVVTACHCTGRFLGETFALFSPKSSLAVIGDVDSSITGSNQVRMISKLIQHPKCKELPVGWTYDYGIFTVTEPFQLTHSVQLIPLVSHDEKTFQHKILLPKSNEPCVAIGWGYQTIDEEGDYFNASSILNKIRIQIIPLDVCETLLCEGPDPSCVHDLKERQQICGLGRGGDVCFGDSGSALVCNGNVYGTVSWGPVCGEYNYPSMYSAIFEVLNWQSQNSMLSATSKLEMKSHFLMLTVILKFIIMN